MAEFRRIADDLQFPEGPVAMPDGSVLVVEVRRGTLTRVAPDGGTTIVADLGGGPNGAAIGPDGACYVVNNGGFTWVEVRGMQLPLHDPETHTNAPPGFRGGWVERVDLTTGTATRLYTECDGHPFQGPNDIVFDTAGGFWFTDFGKQGTFHVDRGGLYYGRGDGSGVTRVTANLLGPNGVGLSPDGRRLYVAETHTGRLLAWDLEAPGVVAERPPEVLVATKGPFDSLAVEADGRIVVAAIQHGLCVIAPDGSSVEYVAVPDPLTTNLCFGGADRRTAFVTGSGAGVLLACEWPRPGLGLAY